MPDPEQIGAQLLEMLERYCALKGITAADDKQAVLERLLTEEGFREINGVWQEVLQ